MMKSAMPASIIFGLMSLWACQGPQKMAEAKLPLASSQLMQSGEGEHNSEGRIAPDDMFFAGQYLGQLTRFSWKDPQPKWSEDSLASRSDGAVFDFQANFSEDRLLLMGSLFFKAADKDGDASISEAEFSAYRWDPSDYGALGGAVNWNFGPEVYRRLASQDGTLNEEALRSWFSKMGPLLKRECERQGEQSYKLDLIRSWEQVLAVHDSDHDGQLNIAEQRSLKQGRAVMVQSLRVR